MIFSEKLDFLLKLTNTSNKQLSVALSVDPSLISRMKQGRRKPPKNSSHIAAMAAYFAKRCTTDYQRCALAETLGQKQIRLIMKSEALAAVLGDWLAGTKPSAVGRIATAMQGLDANYAGEEIKDRQNTKSQIFDSEKSRVYYGNEGKRAAMRAILSYVVENGEPCTILIATDESLEWITESPSFSAELYESVAQLVKMGFSFMRISPRYTSVDEAVDGFTRWLPVYISSKLKTFYYPRLRDDLFHQTMVVAPGTVSMYSCSIGRHIENDATFLNLGADIANVFARQFNDYLAKCLPMTIPHTHNDSSEKISDHVERYMEMPGTKTEKNYGLPVFVTPRLVLERIFRNNREYIDTFVNFTKKYDEMLSRENVTSVIKLADPKDIVGGRVPCSISMLPPGGEICFYTKNEYVAHLKAILRLMEEHLDYTVLALDPDEPGNTICASEGSACYIIGGKDPFTLFEISEQNIISAARAYILSFARSRDGRTRSRRQTIERINELIGILENVPD